MGKKMPLTDRIRDRLEQHQRELAENQKQLDSEMKEMLFQRQLYAEAAKRGIESVVKPRMDELARNFDNARVEIFATDSDCLCVCDLSHIPRFPATVKLCISLSPGTEETLIARYDLSIFPILMEYARNFEDTFPLKGDDNSLALWVEDRILDFLDTYLRLETHPFYQKDNMVIDIVCGMRIASTAATSTVERHGRIFCFCSDHCREAFLRKTE